MSLAGKDDWRLPEIGELQILDNNIKTLVGCSGDDCTGNRTPFVGIQSFAWSATRITPSDPSSDHKVFGFATGGILGFTDFNNSPYAWAVRNGDVGAVPEPGTLALLGVAFAGLAATRRRKQ